ncbi:MAG: DUF4145 domain-containing protein [Pseudolabrys sp.]
MAKVIPPQLGLESFSCPHCNAIAHQNWFRVFAANFSREGKPNVFLYQDAANFEFSKNDNEEERRRLEDFRDRLEKNMVTYTIQTYGSSSKMEMCNLWLSLCYSCGGFGVWILDRLVYPTHDMEIVVHEDLPPALKEDFEEAASIINLSPRGAAALLRLCIQKLMPMLGEKGKDINEDIGNLVRKGLDQRVQKALDAVRVIGNHAVHPGVLDLKDDKATALAMFDLLNAIIAATISANKKIESMYEKIPPHLKTAIEKRDATKGTEPKT